MSLDKRIVHMAVQDILLDYARLMRDKSKASSEASNQATSPLMGPYHTGAKDAYAQSASLLLDAANWEFLNVLINRAIEKVESSPRHVCQMKPDYLEGNSCILESPHFGECRPDRAKAKAKVIQDHADEIVHAQWTIHATEARVLELLKTIDAEFISLKEIKFDHGGSVIWTAFSVSFEAKLGKIVKLVRTCLGIDETDKSPLDPSTEWSSGWNHLEPPSWWVDR